nr:hypothetical protein CFP56_75869 [Quercus suber]
MLSSHLSAATPQRRGKACPVVGSVVIHDDLAGTPREERLSTVTRVYETKRIADVRRCCGGTRAGTATEQRHPPISVVELHLMNMLPLLHPLGVRATGGTAETVRAGHGFHRDLPWTACPAAGTSDVRCSNGHFICLKS